METITWKEFRSSQAISSAWFKDEIEIYLGSRKLTQIGLGDRVFFDNKREYVQMNSSDILHTTWVKTPQPATPEPLADPQALREQVAALTAEVARLTEALKEIAKPYSSDYSPEYKAADRRVLARMALGEFE